MLTEEEIQIYITAMLYTCQTALYSICYELCSFVRFKFHDIDCMGLSFTGGRQRRINTSRPVQF